MTSYVDALEVLNEEAGCSPLLGFDEAAQQMALASIYHLFPDRDWPAMQAIVRGAAFNQSQAVMDLRHATELLDSVTIEDPETNHIKARPFIYAAPHYASYRLIPAYLLIKMRPLTIVIDDLVAQAQGQDFQTMFEGYAKAAGVSLDLLSFRYTSQPTLLMGMVRDLRQGRSLLLYFDGNKSLANKSEHTVPVEFLGHRLLARYGIPEVARITRTPILPVIASRRAKPKENRITFGSLIEPSDKPDFSFATMQQLWANLAYHVSVRPEHWEALRYVHQFIDFSASSGPNERVQNGASVFDHRRFALKRNGDRGEILDRSRFTVTPVKGQVLEALDNLHGAPPLTEASTLVRSEELLHWLARKQFLIDRDGAQKHSR